MPRSGITATSGLAAVTPFRFVPPSFAPLKLAPLRSALLRLASLRLAPLRSALLRLAWLRLAPLRLALLRLAQIRSALLRSALLRLAPLRSALLRSAPLRLAQLRSAPLRLAQLRLAWLRLASIRSAPLRSAQRKSRSPALYLARTSPTCRRGSRWDFATCTCCGSFDSSSVSQAANCTSQLGSFRRAWITSSAPLDPYLRAPLIAWILTLGFGLPRACSMPTKPPMTGSDPAGCCPPRTGSKFSAIPNLKLTFQPPAAA
jgi:hypothetical protein